MDTRAEGSDIGTLVVRLRALPEYKVYKVRSVVAVRFMVLSCTAKSKLFISLWKKQASASVSLSKITSVFEPIKLVLSLFQCFQCSK